MRTFPADYLVVGSDSGRIVILEYDPAKNMFEKVQFNIWSVAYGLKMALLDVQVHQETFGKSGCRRIVPGQYLSVDPKGRAVMIGMMALYPL